MEVLLQLYLAQIAFILATVHSGKNHTPKFEDFILDFEPKEAKSPDELKQKFTMFAKQFNQTIKGKKDGDSSIN